MYAGYVPLGDAYGKKAFYWFVESQRDPKNDPLLVWMNGGTYPFIDTFALTHPLLTKYPQ